MASRGHFQPQPFCVYQRPFLLGPPCFPEEGGCALQERFIRWLEVMTGLLGVLQEESSNFFLILLAEKEVNELMEELFETVSGSTEEQIILKSGMKTLQS